MSIKSNIRNVTILQLNQRSIFNMELPVAVPVRLETQRNIAQFVHPASAPLADFARSPPLGGPLRRWIPTACGDRTVVGGWMKGSTDFQLCSKKVGGQLFLELLPGHVGKLLAGTHLLVDHKAVGHTDVHKMLEHCDGPPLCFAVD